VVTAIVTDGGDHGSWYLQNQCSSDHQTLYTNVPRWVWKLTYFGVKGQGHESRKLPTWVLWVLASSTVNPHHRQTKSYWQHPIGPLG